MAAYYDDLDPGCLTGGISFAGTGYSRLWDLCDQTGLTVIGDVHTHPHTSTAQSWIDTTNPMIAAPGHVALIIPRYAAGDLQIDDVGVHQFQGDGGWTSWHGADAAARVQLLPDSQRSTHRPLRTWWTRPAASRSPRAADRGTR